MENLIIPVGKAVEILKLALLNTGVVIKTKFSLTDCRKIVIYKQQRQFENLTIFLKTTANGLFCKT